MASSMFKTQMHRPATMCLHWHRPICRPEMKPISILVSRIAQITGSAKGSIKPVKQIGEASVDAVDVVGRDPHASSSPKRELSPRRYLEYGTIGNPNPNHRPP